MSRDSWFVSVADMPINVMKTLNLNQLAKRWRAHFPLDAGHFGTTPQPERTNYVHHG